MLPKATFLKSFFNKSICNLIKSRTVTNEPVLQYKPSSKERKCLQQALGKLAEECPEIPIVIGNRECMNKDTMFQVMPHNHQRSIAKFSYATCQQINEAIDCATAARNDWAAFSPDKKCKIWKKAAGLMAGKYRYELNAATMLGQSKTIVQAEIDSACELIDFMKFNCDFYTNWLPSYCPVNCDTSKYVNSFEYRPLDGFVAAITPFNFTAIAGNLAYTPALLGNTVVWKPSDTAMLSNWLIFKIMREAGVPPGVVNFIPSAGETFGAQITRSPNLGAINFTGSSDTFKKIWAMVGEHIDIYKSFPRLIGECGGKNFHFVHCSADEATVLACTLRSAFEYSGQKCSACSVMYIAESVWCKMNKCLIDTANSLKFGDVCDLTTFSSAVIDFNAFDRLTNVLDDLKCSDSCNIICGGRYSNEVGFYIEPTVVLCTNTEHPIMRKELFGPVLAVFVYKDNDAQEVLEYLESTSDYALTGSIFAQDQNFINEAKEILKMAAGNLYINDRSSGAIVGQQPFGGSRLSGTNDKAGCPQYLLRWTSPRTIKTTIVPQTELEYPSMKN